MSKFVRLFPLLAIVPVFLSAFLIQTPEFGFLALCLYLIATGYAIGTRLPSEMGTPINTGLGTLATIASLSLLGSLVYYSSTVTSTKLFSVLLLVSLIASSSIARPSAFNISRPQLPPVHSILLALGSTALLCWWWAAAQVSITEPTRSVWHALDPFTLTSLGIAAMSSLVLLLRDESCRYGAILMSATLFSIMALAAVVYPLGYGFDPFLHRATVAHIIEHGTITPKPLYYIGQYALELVGAKLFALPLFALDALLAPVLASFGITLVFAARRSPVALVFLPFAAFVQTTPQALAFLFTALAIFVPAKPKALPLLFALAAAITHPLAGISALVYVALLFFIDLRTRYRAFGTATIITTLIASALSIPIAFAAQAKLAGLSLGFSFTKLFALHQLPIDTFFKTQYNTWGDIAYSFIGNAFLITLILGVLGIIISRKRELNYYAHALVAGTILLSFVILSLGFDFTFLISYERLDFALRLLTLTSLFLLPYIADLLAIIWERATVSPIGLRVGFVTLLALVFTTNAYAAYPRHDNYARSAGFNVSPTDIDTVYAIEQRANGEQYIVLSDQALAAAAVQELGFKQYYHGDIFFYPIPTGGPLYQHFLTMVEVEPTPETVLAAMDLAGVDLVFFTVHDYWWQSDAIIENTKAITDEWFALGKNDVTVFVFEREKTLGERN